MIALKKQIYFRPAFHPNAVSLGFVSTGNACASSTATSRLTPWPGDRPFAGRTAASTVTSAWWTNNPVGVSGPSTNDRCLACVTVLSFCFFSYFEHGMASTIRCLDKETYQAAVCLTALHAIICFSLYTRLECIEKHQSTVLFKVFSKFAIVSALPDSALLQKYYNFCLHTVFLLKMTTDENTTDENGNKKVQTVTVR